MKRLIFGVAFVAGFAAGAVAVTGAPGVIAAGALALTAAVLAAALPPHPPTRGNRNY